ncbi:hypothetical protein N9V55_01025 [Candidatus Pelagibacter bacterium]|nr:hypothetical protein [Candidatus Pelagibacter bacterium]
MNKKLFFFLFLLSSCGFKVVTNTNNYNFDDIIISGDKRVNYTLKNKLISSSNTKSTNVIKLNIFTDKEKIIKEKNISNKVTKYEIKINAKIDYSFIKNGIEDNLTIVKTGFYDVGTRYSETLNNEKKLTNLLIDSLTKEIIKNLNIKLNDS